MPDYRRNRIPGGTYFFTVNLRDRTSNLLVTQIPVLRAAIRATLTRRPFHIDAWVVLPDHMHALWTLPEGDADFPARWQSIKSAFSRSIPQELRDTQPQMRKRQSGIWQPRYWEHTIRNERDYAAHLDYIHFNPVKHKLVQQPCEWPYSSFPRYVASGSYPASWGDPGPELTIAGERN